MYYFKFFLFTTIILRQKQIYLKYNIEMFTITLLFIKMLSKP